MNSGGLPVHLIELSLGSLINCSKNCHKNSFLAPFDDPDSTSCAENRKALNSGIFKFNHNSNVRG